MSKKNSKSGIGHALETFSLAVTTWSGSSWAFVIALGTIVVWGVTGPVFGFSDTWQLVINTGTTIVTFLMVFLIQRAQNKEALALQVKLNEIIAALDGASNRLIDIEDLSEDEVQRLHDHYQQLGRLLKSKREFIGSHSIDEKVRRRA
ncbi:MAG TPA: low affinity iron permease family protein [Blastocatellia bacterium]|nr:low affinity iron permease family protein [Blastocatellia bacterium]